MGSALVLIVGDDWRHQLLRLQSMEHAEPDNPFIQSHDILAQAQANFLRETRKPSQSRHARMSRAERDAFVSRMRLVHGVGLLAQHETPDVFHAHRWGWLRVLPSGGITELVVRDIPNGFYRSVQNTVPLLLLKPGTMGWDVDAKGQVTEVHAGEAGSARLADIDLDELRRQRLARLQAEWDAAQGVGVGQPWTPPRIDFWLKTREDYVQDGMRDFRLLPCGDLLRLGEYIYGPDNDDWLLGLGDNTLLTYVTVKR